MMKKKTSTLDTTNPESWPYVLNAQQVMEITKMGKNKVFDLLQSGELPAKRVRGRWLINRDAFLAWLKS